MQHFKLPHLIFILTLLAMALKSVTAEELHQARIIRGTPVSTSQDLAIVAIQAQYEGAFYHRCGGTLIAPNKVLTAAHCLMDEKGNRFPPGALRVLTSMIDYSEEGVPTHTVKAITVHPKYSINTLYYDVGIVTLSESLANAPEMILGMPGEDTQGKAWIAGWGSVDHYHGTLSLSLLEGTVNIATRAQCEKQLRKWPRGLNEKTSVKLCAQNNPSNICDGDSGGPLFRIRQGVPVQIGISSHLLSEDCSDQMWSGFTRISAKPIRQFIEQNRD